MAVEFEHNHVIGWANVEAICDPIMGPEYSVHIGFRRSSFCVPLCYFGLLVNTGNFDYHVPSWYVEEQDPIINNFGPTPLRTLVGDESI